MIPLFEMMMQAQNGNALEQMAKQFGMAQEQMAKATAALMPAFSAGLKRNTANPYDLGALMSAMTSGDYSKYFEDITAAFTPQGIADGNGILGQLFGTKEISRTIAAQAAQMTGIGQDIYKQLLPVMATSIMGGLFKQTTGQLGQNPFANHPMAAMTQQWLEATGFARKAEPQPAAMNLFENPFAQSMQGFFGLNAANNGAPQATGPFAGNPFAKAFQDMMASLTPQPAEKNEAAPADPASTVAALSGVMNTLFDSGLEVQKEYQRNIDALFNQYMGGGDKTGAK